MPSESTTESSSSSLHWDYDAFLSYSTGADYRLATKLEKFLERFHQEPGIQKYQLKPLRICMDGSDFRLPRRAKKPDQQKHGDIEQIKEIIRPYLTRSASLLILWPGRDEASDFMNWELEEFLAQNIQMGWDRPVRLAVTRGKEPAVEEKQFFSPKQIEYELHRDIFYDLRGAHPSSSAWAKVRDFEREQFRLATDLENPLGPDGRALSPDDLFPGWRREQLKTHRSERKVLIFRSVVGFAGAATLLLLASLPVFGFPLSWLLLAGAPAVGLLGVLASSFRLRSAAAFALAFSVLVPFYVMGSLKPFGRSLVETVVFGCATILGFAAAGAIGAGLSKQLKAPLGARAFGYGGVIAAIVWLFARDWRIQPLASQFLGPWQLVRWHALLMGLPKAFVQLNHSGKAYLVPLFAGIAVSGFFYGKHLADSRSPLPNKMLRPVRHFPSLKRPLAFAVFGFSIIGSGWFFLSLSPEYQVYLASRRLDIRSFPARTTPTNVEAVRTLQRCKNALTVVGKPDKAQAFSARLSEWITSFGADATRLTTWPDNVPDVARELDRVGAHDEAVHLLTIAFATAEEKKDVYGLALVAKTAHSIGEFNWRDEILQTALTFHRDNMPESSTAMLASALYEAGNLEESRRLLDLVFPKVWEFYQENPKGRPTTVWFESDIGAAVWGTGVWDTLPEWRNQLGFVSSVAQEMLRKGKPDLAVETLCHMVGRADFTILFAPAAESFVRTAVTQGDFQAAFDVIDWLRDGGNTEETLSCLEMIVKVAPNEGHGQLARITQEKKNSEVASPTRRHVR
jgi:hypothetical protein